MLFRLRVIPESVDPVGKTFQARGQIVEIPGDQLDRVALDLEGGAVARFYRGGDPTGRVVAARRTGEFFWMKLRIPSRFTDAWKLVETGAVTTVEIQPLDHGVDVFLKSVAATYPAEIR